MQPNVMERQRNHRLEFDSRGLVRVCCAVAKLAQLATPYPLVTDAELQSGLQLCKGAGTATEETSCHSGDGT